VPLVAGRSDRIVKPTPGCGCEPPQPSFQLSADKWLPSVEPRGALRRPVRAHRPQPFSLRSARGILLSRPEHALHAGDVATLVDFVDHPSSGPRGCVLELFNALGDSIGVVTVPEDAVEPLRADEVLAVRPMALAR
jgi:hypothetical protein